MAAQLVLLLFLLSPFCIARQGTFGFRHVHGFRFGSEVWVLKDVLMVGAANSKIKFTVK